MADVATVARIARLALHLRTGVPLPADDAAVLADCLDRYVDGAELRDALGLKLAAGERDPREAFRVEQRNALIRGTITTHFAHLTSDNGRAHELHTALRRYFAGGWRRDRHSADQPYPVGTLRAALWKILHVWPNPLTQRTLRSILAASPAFSLPTDDGIEEL